ncbi:MAG: hypothetical protein ABUL77_00730 [Bacteroidota bacterium]
MSRSFKWLSAVSRGMIVLVAACEAPMDGTEEVAVTSSALEAAPNKKGIAESIHTSGAIDRTNPFFLVLGTNPRTCETCHAPNQGWTITAKASKELFQDTDGLAPLFMLHDAGSRPDADISTRAARKAAFKKTVMDRALIRFGRTVPAAGEFTVTEVVDPSGFATPTQVTNFRRPTPTSNESKVTNILWTSGPHDVPTQVQATAGGAARFHGQRVDAVPVEQTAAMRDFQLGLIFAQSVDNDAGPLDAGGATGGPANLLLQPFHVGINDIQGGDPSGQPFTRKVFNLFDAWSPNASSHGHHSGDGCDDDDDDDGYSHESHNHTQAARAAIYRGQELFNYYEFDITGVHGLNDVLNQTTVRGTCSTCHNVPNVGGHAVFRMFDVGTAFAPNCSPDLPLLTVKHKVTGETRKTCDMGRGGNGVWADLGAFRAPPLRGLAARAPYFHDGQAQNLKQVVDYFDDRFNIRLNRHQKKDLRAFLGAL